MRRILLVACFGLLLSAGCIAYGPIDQDMGGPVAAGGDIDVGYFYNYLAPYGSWVDFAPWGFVWCPSGVGFEWRPYSFGQWLWTDDGWYWDSFDEWGWAPFHYGRWGWDDGLGWFWVPGSTWGPAWVTWCWNDFYTGWAPLPPGVGFRAGIGIGSLPYIPDRYWCFVDGRNFLGRGINRLLLPFERNRTILMNAQGRENITMSGQRIFNRGIDLDRVERWTGTRVVRYGLENSDRPGPARVGQNSVRVYQAPIARSANARPQNFLQRSDARRRLPEMRRQAESAGAQGDEMRQRQTREMELLQKSQEQERTALQQRQQEEAGRAASQSEKARINQQYQQRAQTLQRQHAQERTQIQQRHQQEQQAVQAKPRRKSQ